VLRCKETEEIAKEERKTLKCREITDVLQNPEHVTVLREFANKISAYHPGIPRR